MTVDLKDELLGKKVTFFRRKMNWPLKTLAAGLSVSIQQLQRYEKGVNKISAAMLYQLSKIFKVELSCFFEDFEIHTEQEEDVYNVLLVEDNSSDGFLLRKALADFPKKLHIYTINDGQAALNFLSDIAHDSAQSLPKPDLIFLDLHLPSVRGLDILKDIKRRVHLNEIPVIVLSSSLNADDRAAAYSLQASGFIRKSFTYQEFKSQLHKAMAYWTDVVDLPHHAQAS
ncbi:MAG: response regulator [Alphaproteobacteria bacterium]